MIGQEKQHKPVSTYYEEYTVGSGYAIMKQLRTITYMYCVVKVLVF